MEFGKICFIFPQLYSRDFQTSMLDNLTEETISCVQEYHPSLYKKHCAKYLEAGHCLKGELVCCLSPCCCLSSAQGCLEVDSLSVLEVCGVTACTGRVHTQS